MELTRSRKKSIKDFLDKNPDRELRTDDVVTRTCSELVSEIQACMSRISESAPDIAFRRAFLKSVCAKAAVLAYVLGTDEFEDEDIMSFSKDDPDFEVVMDRTLCLFGMCETTCWIMRGYFSDNSEFFNNGEDSDEDLSPGEQELAELFAYVNLMAQFDRYTIVDLLD